MYLYVFGYSFLSKTKKLKLIFSKISFEKKLLFFKTTEHF